MIDFDVFHDWAKNRFGEANIRLKNTDHGVEIMTHSFYAHKAGIEDSKFHLWMNPSGGKSKHPEKGSFRCWKTDTRGSLIKLVADYDNVDYDLAEELICGTPSLRLLEQKVHEFFGHKEEVVKEVESDKPLRLPDFCLDINGAHSNHFMCIRARQYMLSRKLPSEGLFVCTDGDYKDRIIIPYYGPNGDLIFYNGRLLNDKKHILRYLKAKNVRQENVLFTTSWPDLGGEIYVMEGEFDAMSVKLAGFHACAIGGKAISDQQIEMLRNYIPILTFDTDSAGLKALLEISGKLRAKGIYKIYYVSPPKVYKDWNGLLKNRNVQTLKAYIERYKQPFTESTETMIRANLL